jgi:hypothetical protein
MVSQEEWFAPHASDSGGGSLTPSSGPRPVSVGFSVDPEAAPAIKTAFEEAIEEMQQARRAMDQMRYLAGGHVNPVVDKYVAALAETGYGDQGSVMTAAESAIAEYQSVIEQLNQVVAGYQDSDEEAAGRQSRVRS